jgi:hypothetical protein
MGNLQTVFLGTHAFSFTLPATAEVETEDYRTIDVPGFEAVCGFRRLEELQATDEPPFTHAQAVAVTEIEEWDFRGDQYASVLVLPEAVRWILCFPVVCKDGVRYAPGTSEIHPGGDDVFFYFTGDTPTGAPIRAVADLDDLKFLSPRAGAKLALVRAKDWEWDEGRNTALIQPQEVAEIEIVLDSEVRVL